MNPCEIKKQFPFFNAHPDKVYLDNAATTQKPMEVIELLNKYFTEQNANAGRSSYALSSKLARRIEETRIAVADFIGADKDEITFTGGASDSFHKAIISIGVSLLEDGDEVLLAMDDHKSFIAPWFQIRDVLAGFGITIHIVPYERRRSGDADIADIRAKASPRTKVIAITHLHNTYGADSDIHELKDLRDRGIIIVVDATQSVGHLEIDVKKIGADVMGFSGHKMFASTGSGVLYVNKKLQEKLTPLFVGGGEGSWLSVKQQKIEYKSFSAAIEAGTSNYPAILSLKPAIDFITSIGYVEIEAHLSVLTMRLLDGLRSLPHIIFAPGPYYWSCRGGYGVLSFYFDTIDSAEIGYALSQEGILVRTGQFCRTDEKGSTKEGLIRVSVHVYNTEEDIDKVVKAIKCIVESGCFLNG